MFVCVNCFSFQSVASVQSIAQRKKTDFRRFHRVPQRWQKQRDQHVEKESSLQSSTRAGRNQSVAVHHADASRVSHRLPRGRSSD